MSFLRYSEPELRLLLARAISVRWPGERIVILTSCEANHPGPERAWPSFGEERSPEPGWAGAGNDAVVAATQSRLIYQERLTHTVLIRAIAVVLARAPSSRGDPLLPSDSRQGDEVGRRRLRGPGLLRQGRQAGGRPSGPPPGLRRRGVRGGSRSLRRAAPRRGRRRRSVAVRSRPATPGRLRCGCGARRDGDGAHPARRPFGTPHAGHLPGYPGPERGVRWQVASTPSRHPAPGAASVPGGAVLHPRGQGGRRVAPGGSSRISGAAEPVGPPP